MSPIVVHRRLQAETERAEHAWVRAQANRAQLMESIARLEQELAPGIDPTLASLTQARLVQQTIELQRFDRDVAVVLEELRTLAQARLHAFGVQYARERRFQRMTTSKRGRSRRERAPREFARPRPMRARILRMMMSC